MNENSKGNQGGSRGLARQVAIFRDPELTYPSKPPFNPPVEYPEYPFKDKGQLDEHNQVYHAVRETLRLLSLDEENFDTPDWNPLKEIVRPGDKVVIKPNLVLHRHINDESVFSIATHGSVVRAIADYVFMALRGEGSIIIADAPLFFADFDKLSELSGLKAIAAFFSANSEVRFSLMDLRRVRSQTRNGVIIDRQTIDTHETESLVVDLGAESALAELGGTLTRLFGSDYDRRETCSHHNEKTNEYCLSRRVLECDALISVPKLKTHKKTGVTLNLKNLVGANTDKNYLPHYRVGDELEGGDEYPVETNKFLRARAKVVRKAIDCVLARQSPLVAKLIATLLPVLFPVKRKGRFRSDQPQIDRFYEKVLKKSVRMGNWEGNDTAWRMVLDIARAFFYADPDGVMQEAPQRRFFSIIDGVIAGDRNGPTAPAAHSVGVLVAGFDPVAVDVLAARLMGFDPERIKQLSEAARQHRFPLGSAEGAVIRTNWDAYRDGISAEQSLHLRPPDHWDSISI